MSMRVGMGMVKWMRFRLRMGMTFAVTVGTVCMRVRRFVIMTVIEVFVVAMGMFMAMVVPMVVTVTMPACIFTLVFDPEPGHGVSGDATHGDDFL